MRVALSVGCPCGIGPEVALAALVPGVPGGGSVTLVGDRGAIDDAAAARGIRLESRPDITVLAVSDLPRDARLPGRPSPAAGRAQLAAVDAALDEVLAGRADAIVTGPVSKAAIASAGVHFVGHTEHLQARTQSGPVVMLFAGPTLRTSLVTTHLAVADLPRAIDRDAVHRTVVITARALWRDFGLESPRIVVTGLNPHAGEHGMFGREEIDTIEPAVQSAAADLAGLATVHGPMAAEAAFRQARDGRWDAVVAMFHDQATIASKLLDFGESVNVTLGLPVVRTSVDHGTGYDIAGRGVADAAGMRAALDLAFRIVARRRGAVGARAGT